MRMMHLTHVCSCSLAIAAGMMAGRAAAEPVQPTLTPDAATVGLWLFEEGQGERVACAVKGPAGTLRGAVWVPGREGFAVATRAGHVAIPDDPALRPAQALTVELWVKLARSGGDLVVKNQAYMMRLGGPMQAYLSIDGRWRVVNGRWAVPTGRWTHLAMTYDAATRTAALYIDGVLDTKQQIPGLTTGLLNQGTAELRLGANDWSPMGSEVDGKVASLRISNIARTFEPVAPRGRQAAPAGNLVPNGDFELGLLGWRLAGEGDANLVWDADTAGSASGRRCLRSLPGGGDALLSRPVPAIPGMRYTLGARMRADAAGRQGTLSAQAAGGSGGLGREGAFRQSADLDTGWKQLSRSFTLPEDWAAPSLCVRIECPRVGQLWVDEVRLTAGGGEGAPLLRDRIVVGPETAPVGHLFFAGRPAPITLRLANTDTRPHRVSVRASVVDWEGATWLPAGDVGTFEVPAGGERQVPFAINTRLRGAFRLGFDLAAEGQSWRQAAEFKYAVVVPLQGVGAAEGSAFGMNTHMEREPTPHLARNMEVLAQCGVKWIRGWWGWGMCEKERGQFDWSEYDRQLATVEDAGMRLMPILLRYYPQYEQAWAGATDGIQRPPYKMEEWGAFVRKVAERYKGRVSAWELWNEPTTDGAGFTPETYAALLRATAPPFRELDPKAKIVGFAGVDLPFIEKTLALGTAPALDVVSEHSYSQVQQPEANLPKRMAAVRAVLTANGGDKPIWHTEQGVGADGDGYLALSPSEADVAALYTRNFVSARSQGVAKYFWFSAQTSPTYGWGVFYEDYIPRPRLVALNACASFLEGATFRRSFRPGRNAYAHLFEGAAPVCVAWNLTGPARLSLPLRPDTLEAFDLMGNPVQVVAEQNGAVVPLPAERPVYLRAPAGEGPALEKALAAAKAVEVAPAGVTARRAGGGINVTVTSTSRVPLDGVVELAPAGKAPRGWPAPQHFHSLLPGTSRTFSFPLPAGATAGQVRVQVGDREMREVVGDVGG